jgi:23S rRNA pseudouridine1911/1915/1917 synthase
VSEELPVPPALAGERIDRAVAMLTGWSRSEVQVLVAEGAVLVDGATVAKSRKLEEGEIIELLSEPQPPGLPAADPAVAIVVRYEDPDVVVVAKPAGLVVHPGAGHPDGTLVNGLLARFPEIATVGEPQRPGIVHRLDRDTSGLLVVARDEETHAALSAMIRGREVEREYAALVEGRPPARTGTIDAPLGRDRRVRTRMSTDTDDPRDAVTHFEVEEALPRTTLLAVRLETGRTHQIRAHLKAIGHPVCGDPEYGTPRRLGLARQFLHARRVAFAHPRTGAAVDVSSPLPDELRRALAAAARE